MTRAANAAAAAAVAVNASSIKTPSENPLSGDSVVVKKERTNSPAHSLHTSFTCATPTLTSNAASTISMAGDGKRTPTSHLRRNSMQSVQEKLTHFHQQQQHHHYHQQQQQQQQHQQQQHQSGLSQLGGNAGGGGSGGGGNDEQRSPSRYPMSGGMAGGGNATPSPQTSDMTATPSASTATSSQHSSTPKLSEREDRPSEHAQRLMGSITCLPPAALNAVAAAAAASSSATAHQATNLLGGSCLSVSHVEKMSLTSPRTAGLGPSMASATASLTATEASRREFDISKINCKYKFKLFSHFFFNFILLLCIFIIFLYNTNI